MRHSQERGLPRAVAVVAATVLAVSISAGCTGGQKPETQVSTSNMDIIASDIQSKLAARPDVAQAKVVYQDNITAPGSALVSVVAKPGADLKTVLDDSIKLVWTSKLTPLKSINVGVADPQNPSRGITKLVVPANANEKAELESKYGPRPK